MQLQLLLVELLLNTFTTTRARQTAARERSQRAADVWDEKGLDRETDRIQTSQ